MKGSSYLNPVLTGIAVKYMNASPSVGRALFPVFNTGERAASYYVLDSSNWLNVPSDIRHAPGALFKRSETVLSTDTFNAKDYGIEELIPNEEIALYGSVFNAQRVASERATNIVAVNHELRVKALATGGSVPNSSPSTKWDQANSNPIKDVKMAREAIWAATGLVPNKIVIPRAVMVVLEEHPAITAKYAYTDGSILTQQMIAKALGVDEIIVAGSQINTANEGQAATISQIWSDSVVLAVVNNSQDLKAVNFGRTFNWTSPEGSSASGIGVYQYREDNRDAQVVRARQYTDEKLVGSTAGYHLSDVLS